MSTETDRRTLRCRHVGAAPHHGHRPPGSAMIDVPPTSTSAGRSTAGRERTGDPVLLDSSDLTTHGVIVGMTGSGKTGLGVVLLEEALLAGVPTLIVDPKGDLGNLLLTFPELRPDDFALGRGRRPRRGGRAVAGRAGRVGHRARPHRRAARRRRVHHLHPRIDRGRAPQHGRQPAPAGRGHRRGDGRRRGRGLRVGPARHGGSRVRPAVRPRAHPARQPDPPRLGRRRRPRPGHAGGPGAGTAAAGWASTRPTRSSRPPTAPSWP